MAIFRSRSYSVRTQETAVRINRDLFTRHVGLNESGEARPTKDWLRVVKFEMRRKD